MTDSAERWREWPVEEPTCLYVYAIYDRPKDHPDHFVVRRWKVVRGKPTRQKPVVIADSLEDARTCVPPGKMRFDRTTLVRDVIAEAWL